MDIEEKIQMHFIGGDYSGDINTIEELNNLTGKKFRYYDGGIDDGADDETEDTYIMYKSFTCGDIDVILYYGDVTEEIGYVEVEVR